MIYTLMNKNVEFAEIDMVKGHIENIVSIREENARFFPVFLTSPGNGGIDISKRDLDDWWSGRCIPASRGGVKELLWHLNISLNELAEKSLGLSLSDQYWIRPDKKVKWSDVNFFDNNFSEDIGKLLIAGDWNGGDLASPDNTSDGVVRKRWKIIDGQKRLVKGSYSTVGIPQAQPFREVFASNIARVLFRPFDEWFVVPYKLLWEGDYVYSVCPNFVTVDTEYVSFVQIDVAHNGLGLISGYDFCKQFYKGYEYVLDLMLILDYIVLNDDRHFGNFGMIRSVDTGEFTEPAPVFDTGSSLFYDSLKVNEEAVAAVRAKPFHKDFDRQIKLVDLNLYGRSINLVKKEAEDIFYEVFDRCFEDRARVNNMLRTVKRQIEKLG